MNFSMPLCSGPRAKLSALYRTIAQLPQRLLDVLILYGDISVRIKKVDRADRGARYATLSRQRTQQIARAQFVLAPAANLYCRHCRDQRFITALRIRYTALLQ
jgi:hypothetical protein